MRLMWPKCPLMNTFCLELFPNVQEMQSKFSQLVKFGIFPVPVPEVLTIREFKLKQILGT